MESMGFIESNLPLIILIAAEVVIVQALIWIGWIDTKTPNPRG